MGNLPTRFWMAQGFGIAEEDLVNAYDNALYHAGLADQNIRTVSSVPPNTQVQVHTRDGYTYIPTGFDLAFPMRPTKWTLHNQTVKREDIELARKNY